MNKSATREAIQRLMMLLLLMFVTMATAGAKNRSPLGFGMHSYEQHSHLNADTYWKCDYPVFERSPAGDIINAAILNALVSSTPSDEKEPTAKTIEQAAAKFIDEAEQIQRGEREHVWSWESDTKAQVLLNQPGIVTISISTYAFTGGAHGMSVTQYLVFDTVTGRQFALNDFFAQGFEAQLDKLIERRFRQIRGLSETDPLNGEKGGLFENQIRHNDNFAVTGSGVRFLYNQYEIAPYAAGQIEIELPFNQLRDILKPLEAIKPLLHENSHSSK